MKGMYCLVDGASCVHTGVAVAVSGQSVKSNVCLTESVLQARNLDDEALRMYWDELERERVQRLVQAGKELGFELPRGCW